MLECGRIGGRRPVPVIDALLGEKAIVDGPAVVTRHASDIRHRAIARTGASIVDPWT